MAEWRCFHCDEVFTTTEAAIEHFGRTERQSPACQIDIAHYREMEQQVLACNQEDSEVHREMHGLLSDHRLALVREEERGYARGLEDAQKHPETLGLQAIAADQPAPIETLCTALEILYDMGREDADLPDAAYEDARRGSAINAAMATLIRLGAIPPFSQAHEKGQGSLPYWASPTFDAEMPFTSDDEASASPAPSLSVPTLGPAEIERRTAIAFESTNDSDQMPMHKYWFAKGLREGAAIAETSRPTRKTPAQREHVNSLLAFVTMGFHGRVNPTIADAQHVWEGVTRADGPLAWVPDVLQPQHGDPGSQAANEDTARLDHLEATHSTLFTCAHTERRPRTTLEGGYDTVTVHDGWCVNMHGEEKPTVREAIDADRFPQRETPEVSNDLENRDEGGAS